MTNLTASVQDHLARGGRIESQTDHMTVIVHGQRANHVLHLLLTVVTFGLWFPVWAVVDAKSWPRKYLLTVDESGKVHEQDVTEPRGLYGKRKAKKRRQAAAA